MRYGSVPYERDLGRKIERSSRLVSFRCRVQPRKFEDAHNAHIGQSRYLMYWLTPESPLKALNIMLAIKLAFFTYGIFVYC